MKILNINISTIEFNGDKYYLTIGKKAPWDNTHIRIPIFVARWINKRK